MKRATDAALASYVANLEAHSELGDPLLAFIFCYLAAHHGLGLLSEDDTQELMELAVRRRTDVQQRLDERLERFRGSAG